MDELKDRVMEAVKVAEVRGESSLLWAMEVGRVIQEREMEIPSLELAEILVGSIRSGSNRPALWKFLDHAMTSRLVFPMHALALLTSWVIPRHKIQPEAYRLYLEMLGQHILSRHSTDYSPRHKILIKCTDDAMRLSDVYGVQIGDLGQTVVWFLFSIIINLVDCLLKDCGLHIESQSPEKNLDAASDMDIDTQENSDEKRNQRRKFLQKVNMLVASKTLEKITSHKKARTLLRLIHLNMPEKFNCLLYRLQLKDTQQPTSENLLSIWQELTKISENVKSVIHDKFNFNHLGSMRDSNSYGLSNYHIPSAGQAACWISFDIFMEKIMDARHFYAQSAVDLLAGLIISLHVVNQASWQETFNALWVSALRLVQRERNAFEGPLPHLDARLCILLSITPLAIASIVDAEYVCKINEGARTVIPINNKYTGEDTCSSRRRELVSSIQLLGQFEGLLLPPPAVVHEANYAASKAASFICNFKKGVASFDSICHSDTSVKANGNMLHLIVEACIARKLIDSSVYFWPGYVVSCSSSETTDSVSGQQSSWSAFMEGAQLSIALKNSLLKTPASSIVQVEKLYHIALNGSEEDRSAAANVLCGASLSRGWNIQEHVVRFVVKLLSPPAPPEFSDLGSHLYGYMAILNSILFGACCIDVVHIISLHGMVPEVAAALMPLCEAFGTLVPLKSSDSTSEEPSVYSVFSYAFLFLLRLWKFYSPPLEHCIAERWAHTELNLDYLLLIHNSRVESQNITHLDRNRPITEISDRAVAQPVYIDAFPKLRAWYSQNQACVASILSASTHYGNCIENPDHEVANKILNMICQKMTKVGSSGNNHLSAFTSTGGSSVSMGEDLPRPLLPAWEILGAVPFVVEALLTACANGSISSRELTTGLRDLVDFLPASLATVVTYFTAEVTRGIWKTVHMNGIDWPSPAANLQSFESEVKGILASAGVHVPSHYEGRMAPVMLPLPMAALVGLTITFKLDKRTEYILGVVGPALENCATCCPWPSMPIIGALWEQKVRRWHDFIIFSSVRSPFRQDKDAICQLLKSCFESFLGPSTPSDSHTVSNHGVNGLLGRVLKENATMMHVAPGFLYIRSCRGFLDTRLVSQEILKLVSASARDAAPDWHSSSLNRLKSNQVSLAYATVRAKEIATLGSSLLCATGGVRLVQMLYMETLPTFLLAGKETRTHATSLTFCSILEGYALAHTVILSGIFVWGVGGASRPTTEITSSSKSRCGHVISYHMDFIARSFEGDVSLGCDPVTWKAYVSCFVALLVRFMPDWVSHAKQGTLKKIAEGLRGWHEYELALSLLERGGPEVMEAVVKLIL